MQRTLLVAGIFAAAFVTQQAQAQAPAAKAEVTLSRLECGTPTQFAVNQRFSDTYSYGDLKLDFVFSCYLIKHGNDYMLWDTGFSMTTPERAPKVSLIDQLAKANITADQIKTIGISHYHGDHLGGASQFPKATLLIGKGDWDELTSAKPREGANPALAAPWIKDGGKVEPVPLDKDVFGDGSVMMLYMPGHTAGHHALLVKLPQTGAVLLVGDLVHFHENWDNNGVPAFNVDRAQSLASIDRAKKLAGGSKATVVIQHDARDVGKLPAFPAFAK